MQYLFFSVSLFSLSIIPSKYIHIVAVPKFHSFKKIFFCLWPSSILGCLCVWCVCLCVHLYIRSSFSIYLLIDTLGCSRVLLTVNNAAVTIGVHVSFQISAFIFFSYILWNGMFLKPLILKKLEM